MRKFILSAVLILAGSMVSASVVNMPSAPTYGTESSVSNSAPSANYKKHATYNYTPEDKKVLYDAIIEGFFEKRSSDLIAEGYNKNSVVAFITESKAKFNRTELENASWNCLSKYSPDEMINNVNEITMECFSDWILGYAEKEQEIAKKHLRK